MKVLKKQELIKKSIESKCKSCFGNGCRECAAKVERINKMANAGIPVSYWDYSLDTFTGNDLFRGVIHTKIDCIEEMFIDGAVLIFMGAMGVGKTFGGIEILKSALVKNYSALYTTFTEIIDMLLSKTESLYFKNTMLAADYLMIDELDTRYMLSSEHAREIYGANLEYIIRTRMQNKLPMILCTNNSDLDILDGIFGTAFKSLLAQKNVSVIPVGGADLRQKR